MEFDKLESQALIGFVEQARDESENMKKAAAVYKKNSDKILNLMEEKKLLHKLDLTKENLDTYSKIFTDAVDGSNQYYQKPDGSFIYFFSTARIRYQSGYTSKVEVTVTPHTETINEIEEKSASNNAEKIMLSMETETMKRSLMQRNDDGLLFLDGPIIDPPGRTISSEYLSQRTLSIKDALNKKIMTIGIVKRVLGDMFTNKYKNYFDDNDKKLFEQMHSDKNLAIHVLTKYLSSEKNLVAYTEPLIMNNSIAEKYHNYGVDVLTFIMKNGYHISPIRVDVALPTNNKDDIYKIAEKAIKHVVAWAAPGRHIPVPVILAHEKCNIGQGAAEILFTEFITGSKTDDNEENIIQIQMMGEVH